MFNFHSYVTKLRIYMKKCCLWQILCKAFLSIDRLGAEPFLLIPGASASDPKHAGDWKAGAPLAGACVRALWKRLTLSDIHRLNEETDRCFMTGSERWCSAYAEDLFPDRLSRPAARNRRSIILLSHLLSAWLSMYMCPYLYLYQCVSLFLCQLFCVLRLTITNQVSSYHISLGQLSVCLSVP